MYHYLVANWIVRASGIEGLIIPEVQPTQTIISIMRLVALVYGESLSVANCFKKSVHFLNPTVLIG